MSALGNALKGRIIKIGTRIMLFIARPAFIWFGCGWIAACIVSAVVFGVYMREIDSQLAPLREEYAATIAVARSIIEHTAFIPILPEMESGQCRDTAPIARDPAESRRNEPMPPEGVRMADNEKSD